MYMKKSITILFLAALQLTNVYAQRHDKKEYTNFADTTFNINEVVIQSSVNKRTEVLKMPVPLKEMPIAVSQVSPRLIQDLSLTTLQTATRYATGVKPINTYGGFQTFKLRGFYDFVLMTDGVRDERHNLSQSATSTSTAAVEKIEVLKGPASVLYGHSALGGVINVMRKQPSAETHINAEAGAASWGRYNVQVGGSGAISKKLNLRFDASIANGEGWRSSYDRTANLYAALDYNIDHRNKLEFKVGGNNDWYGTETGIPHVKNDIYNASGTKIYNAGDMPQGIDLRQRYNDPADFLTHKGYNATAKWKHIINKDWKLTEYLSYFDDDNNYFNTESLAFLTSDTPKKGYENYYMNGEKKVYICLDSIRRNSPLRFAYHAKVLQNQFDVTGKFKTGGIEHNIVTGYTFTLMNRNGYSASVGATGKDGWGPGKQAVISTINPLLNQGAFETKFSSKTYLYEYIHGVFVQDYIKFIPQLRTLIGLRYDRYDRYYQKATTDNKEVLEKGDKSHLKNNSVTWRVGLVYDINDQFNIFASGTNYFKPSRTIANDATIHINNKGERIYPNGDNIFDPETGYQFEFGSHLDLANSLQVNLATYYIRKNNMVQNLGTYENMRISGQVGSADSKGLELDVNYSPVKDLSITAGYTFNVTKYREYATNDYMTNDLKGKYHTQAPKHMAYGWVFYDFSSRTLNGLSVAVGAEYSSKAFATADNTIAYDPYAIANLMAKYKYRKYQIKVNVNNLFNKTYFRNAVNSTQFIPEEKRNVSVTLGFYI